MACNKKVNVQNDLHNSDASVQSIENSADPQLPTATFTVGLSRTITFERMTKVVLGGKGIASWLKTNPKHFDESELEDGSIFVLEPNNDKPTKSQTGEGVIHETKHRIDFNGDSISIAFAFRLV